MVNAQQVQFDGFAGQLVPSGIAANMPLVGLEDSVSQTTYSNLTAINGLIPKIKDIFIRETRVFENPLRPYITRFDERFGAGLEQAAFMEGAYNEQQDGTCVPRGTPDMASQLDLVNFAYSVDVDVKDYEIDKAVLDEGQRGSYVAQKLRTPLKTIGSLEYRAWVQLLSDVINGTRSVSSKNAFNGAKSKSGAATVTYNPTITGYAGKVDVRTEVMPTVEVGTQYQLASASDALAIVNQLKAVAADFAFETDEFNKLGLNTFSTGVPLLIAEKKVLDAMDTIFAEVNLTGQEGNGYGYAGFPTVSAREYIRQFAEIVEIDTFAPLPTNASYANLALHFVLIDRDAFVEVVKNATVEGQRCAKARLTGYNWQGESILSIWRGVNSYALVFPTYSTVTFTSGQFTVSVGENAISSGDTVQVGATVVVEAATGYALATVTVNGESVEIGADGASFTMPNGPVTLTVTTSEA